MRSSNSIRYEALTRSSEDTESSREKSPSPRRSSLRRKIRFVQRVIISFVLAILCLIIFTGLFNPSYANLPAFDIPTDERVYIAANIIDGDLIDGAWGSALERLINSIGKDRVYVSVYGGPNESLEHLEKRLDLGERATILAEKQEPIPWEDIPHISLPDGASKIKRIAYLAEVRNKALKPLESLTETFDKILFINDVVFEPEDAQRLLWGTRVGSGVEGKTDYRAACAVDFINPFKFYDTFATRDLEGCGMGLPFFPWFADVGGAESRKDVLAGKDAVRVRSCWGGMVSFDTKFFQGPLPHNTTSPQESPSGSERAPIRFRSEPDPFWDASECCLINADIQQTPDFKSGEPLADTGIYMNPYVRVAYSRTAYKYTHLISRFEKLFSLPHKYISSLANMPRPNPRRFEVPGETVQERVWVFHTSTVDSSYGGSLEAGRRKGIVDAATATEEEYAEAVREMGRLGDYQTLNRTASRGGYCGTRQLLVMRTEGREGKNWEKLVIPPP